MKRTNSEVYRVTKIRMERDLYTLVYTVWKLPSKQWVLIIVYDNKDRGRQFSVRGPVP